MDGSIMPRNVQPLTDLRIKTAKPRDKIYKLADGGGLYLEVHPTGSKHWRMSYTQSNHKKTRLSFGAYPVVTLAGAREKRLNARKMIEAGTDPAAARRAAKHNRNVANANTFEVIAREWHAHMKDSWKESTSKNVLQRLANDIFPVLGDYPITDIKAPEMLGALRKIERRGAPEMARRCGQFCGQVFRYAIATGRAEYDPMPHLRGALKPRNKGHHPAITPDELPEFLQVLNKHEFTMFMQTRIMLRLMMMVFVRTSELTQTPWSEIDFENEVWIIKWNRMKMGKKKINPRKVDHHVHLPRQGWVLLRELRTLTGRGEYLFPNRNDRRRPTSNFGILAALKRMGYAGRMTGHGFRSLAMGVLKERLGYRHEVVDRQLAHLSGDTYGEAYNRAMFLQERKVMMQEYADYLDVVAGSPVVAANPVVAAFPVVAKAPAPPASPEMISLDWI
jgi:integrase